MKKEILRALLAVFCVLALLAGCADPVAPTNSTAGPTAAPATADRPAESTEDNSGTEPGDEPGDNTETTDFTFIENADGTLTLTGYTGTEAVLDVPAALNGKSVSAIGESCFAGLVCLRSVHIPEGVANVGDYAFECCSLLQKVYFPYSLLSIGDGAFSGCECLTLADMQEGLESIGRGAFLYCVSLVQLELPETLTDLGDFAFAGCDALTSVRFGGDRVTALPDRLFYGCSSLSRLRLSEGVTSVGKRAFSGCEKVEALYFAEPLTSLGEYAFENCSRLSNLDLRAEAIPTGLLNGCLELSWFSLAEGTVSIAAGAFRGAGIGDLSIPDSVETIEPCAFYSMHGSLLLDKDNPNYMLIDGSLYTKDGKTLLAFFPEDPYAEEPQTAFAVPEGVEVIASGALAESGLSSLTLPASLKRIEAYAFADTGLEELEIPDTVEVDPDAFRAPGQQDWEPEPEEPGEETAPEVLGSVAGDRNLFREEDFASFREITNDDFDAWGDEYLAYNEAQGLPLTLGAIPYIIRYKGEVVPHFMPMTAVQNRDPDMWAQAAEAFGDDFEQMYLMMDHGLSTELSRGKMPEDLILYSGLYDSQLMAAAGTDTVPTQEQLVEAIGNTFTDPIMISTTTDPGVAANFGDTLFIVYASREAMEDLGAVCIDAVSRSSEKEILMNSNARYRILDVGNMEITQQDPWDPEPRTVYRSYVKVELLPAD